MKLLAADDERPALSVLTHAIEAACPDAEIRAFTRQSQIIEELDSGFKPDAVFLDVEMPGMSGPELAKTVREKCPETEIFFVTGYSSYALEKYKIHASGYISKPASKEKILEKLHNLHSHEPAPGKRVKITCFGNFSIKVDEKPLKFRYPQTEELLAYLVDRKGGFCSSAEIIGTLWGNGTGALRKKALFRKLRADLLKTLQEVDCAGIIERRQEMLAVIPGSVSCDYFDWQEGLGGATNAYTGEYMSQYSWSALTFGKID